MKKRSQIPIPSKCKRLKELRKEKELTQNEIANRIGVTPKTYRSWEIGSTQKTIDGKETIVFPNPDIDSLIKLSEIFNCSIDYLLCRSDCKVVDNDYISKKTGLSEKSINVLSKRHCDVIDSFIQSKYYEEIDENGLYWLENNYRNFQKYIIIVNDIQNTAENGDISSRELDKLANEQEKYFDKIEHNYLQIDHFNYNCSLSFGKFLDDKKREFSEKYEFEKYLKILNGKEKQ